MTMLIVASTNPVKIDAAAQGFRQMFPQQTFTVEGLSVPSGVSVQPMTNAETYEGAYNRAVGVRAARPEADYWIGIEGGAEETAHGLEAFAWVVILSTQRAGTSRTATFILPNEVAAWVRAGMELGEADDRVFGRENSKQANGSVGLLTGDVIDRTAYYAHAVVLALIPFKQMFMHPGLTFP